MCIKFGLKIPDHFGKNVRKNRGGGFFDSDCILCNEVISGSNFFVVLRLQSNHSINTWICIAQNKQSMSSNALSVTALEQTSFQFFAESVNLSRHTVVVRSSVGRVFHVAGPHTLNARRPRTVLVRWLSRVPLTEERSWRFPANDDTGTQSLLR